MSVPIQPLADYVVATAEKAETKTTSGFYLPEKAQEKPKTAIVVAVGPGKVNKDGKIIPMSIKVGDRILCESFSTSEVKVDGQDFILVKQTKIMATVK